MCPQTSIPETAGSLTPGLCSVTFRQLSTTDIIARAVASGLRTIEWGADLHVPVGALATAAEVRDATLAAGLSVSALGSYFRAGRSGADYDEDREWRTTCETALALGAPRIRVWAGELGSDDASADYRDHVGQSLRRAADLAAELGLEVGLEFHAETLTDTAESTNRLLDAIDRANALTYWQPPNGMPDALAIESLLSVVHRVSTIHVFSWWPDHSTRLPLAARLDLWREVVGIVAGTNRRHDLLLEFLPDDDPAVLSRDAETLRGFAAAHRPSTQLGAGRGDR